MDSSNISGWKSPPDYNGLRIAPAGKDTNSLSLWSIIIHFNIYVNLHIFRSVEIFIQTAAISITASCVCVYIHCRSVTSRSVISRCPVYRDSAVDPKFSTCKKCYFCLFYLSRAKKKNGIQCGPVLVFPAYLGPTSRIWCGFRQTTYPIKAIQ